MTILKIIFVLDYWIRRVNFSNKIFSFIHIHQISISKNVLYFCQLSTKLSCEMSKNPLRMFIWIYKIYWFSSATIWNSTTIITLIYRIWPAWVSSFSVVGIFFLKHELTDLVTFLNLHQLKQFSVWSNKLETKLEWYIWRLFSTLVSCGKIWIWSSWFSQR